MAVCKIDLPTISINIAAETEVLQNDEKRFSLHWDLKNNLNYQDFTEADEKFD